MPNYPPPPNTCRNIAPTYLPNITHINLSHLGRCSRRWLQRHRAAVDAGAHPCGTAAGRVAQRRSGGLQLLALRGVEQFTAHLPGRCMSKDLTACSHTAEPVAAHLPGCAELAGAEQRSTLALMESACHCTLCLAGAEQRSSSWLTQVVAYLPGCMCMGRDSSSMLLRYTCLTDAGQRSELTFIALRRRFLVVG